MSNYEGLIGAKGTPCQVWGYRARCTEYTRCLMFMVDAWSSAIGKAATGFTSQPIVCSLASFAHTSCQASSTAARGSHQESGLFNGSTSPRIPVIICLLPCCLPFPLPLWSRLSSTGVTFFSLFARPIPCCGSLRKRDQKKV